MHLVGDASKAKRVLGWEPKIPFEDLIKEMTEAELNALKG
jgi:GDPmannose 4,6-dehydratase